MGTRTIECNSWDSIVNALITEAIEDETDRVIHLTNDIDLNYSYPDGVSVTSIATSMGISHHVTISGDNGQGGNYIIKNLRTNISNPSPIFIWSQESAYSDAVIDFENIDFQNLILSGGHFYDSAGETRQLNFTNCRFVGYRTGHAYLINQTTKINCTSCYFDMPWYGAGSEEYDYCSIVTPSTVTSDFPVANYCWFHETYGGWTISSGYGSSSVTKPATETPTVQCSQFAMSGCYIDGSMKRPYQYTTSGASTKYVYTYCYVFRKALGNYFTSSTPNVVDMHWWCAKKSELSAGSNTVYACNMSGLFKKDVLFSDASGSSWSGQANSQPNVTFATATQMQNIEWLRAAGFPIIDDVSNDD